MQMMENKTKEKLTRTHTHSHIRIHTDALSPSLSSSFSILQNDLIFSLNIKSASSSHTVLHTLLHQIARTLRTSSTDTIDLESQHNNYLYLYLSSSFTLLHCHFSLPSIHIPHTTQFGPSPSRSMGTSLQ